MSLPSRYSRRGAILVLVLVVITLLTLSVLVFAKFMSAEQRGATQSLRRTQARLLAESGVEYLRILLMKESTVVADLGGLYDNESEFMGHIITDGTISMIGRNAGVQSSLQSGTDYQSLGRFSVIATKMSADGLLLGEEIRYGLNDESTKVNLRWIMQTEKQQPGMGRSILMRLPGVTEEIADSLLDWMDEDSEPREYGAEDEYYSTLDPPYYTKNGIPDSIDELLLVKGITPKLLYGVDWNRNGVVDIGEPDESSLEEFDVSDGSLNLGLAALLTVDSRESNVTPDGEAKINVNMDDLEELRTLLEERFSEHQDWVDYIISYRQKTSTSTTGGAPSALSGALGGAAGGASGSGTKINSLLDLVQSSSSTGTATGGTGGNNAGSDSPTAGLTQQTTSSPFSNDLSEMNNYLPNLYDNLTIGDEPVVGRININQSSRTVLELLAAQDDVLSEQASTLSQQADAASQVAELTGTGSATSLSTIPVSDIIEGILEERVSDPNLIDQPEMNYPFWPYTHGIIEDLETMKKLEPYFCTQGGVFHAMVVGRFDERSPVVRLEVWLDATTPGKPAKIIRIRDMTELGPGYASEMLGVAEY